MKKQNNNATETQELAISLRDLMTTYTDVTLAKLADATNAPYAAVRAKAKQPIAGQVYDATAINYEAVETYLLKRDSELRLAELPWKDMNVKSERVAKTLKDSNVDFSVGKIYYLRYFKSNWTIVYATETHICMMLADGSSTQPKVMAKTTFISCGVKPEQKPESESAATVETSNNEAKGA